MSAEGADAPISVSSPGQAGEMAVDFSFYSAFWGLQKSFSQPINPIRPDEWDKLVEQLKGVLSVFNAFPQHVDEAEETENEGGGDGDGAESLEVENFEALQEVYFAKFLTSSKLINLQLRDSYFRRHVIVQMLIFLQASTSHSCFFAP